MGGEAARGRGGQGEEARMVTRQVGGGGGELGGAHSVDRVAGVPVTWPNPHLRLVLCTGHPLGGALVVAWDSLVAGQGAGFVVRQ